MDKGKPEMECKVDSEDDEDEDDDNVFLLDEDRCCCYCNSDETDDRRQALVLDMVRTMERSIEGDQHHRRRRRRHRSESTSDDVTDSSPMHRSTSTLDYATPQRCSSDLVVNDQTLVQQQQQQTDEPSSSSQSVLQFGADLFRTERDFIDYLVSLPASDDDDDDAVAATAVDVTKDASKQLSSRTTTTLSESVRPVAQTTTGVGVGVQNSKVGLDHLENLCKLMERLGELRAQNCRLQKRVQYLEEMRCPTEMRKELKEALEAAAATSLSTARNDGDGCDHSEVVDVKDDAAEREDIVKRIDPECAATMPTASSTTTAQRKATKISKWTKVKEALKWERATSIDNSNKATNTAKDGHPHQSAFFVVQGDDTDDGLHPPLTSVSNDATKSSRVSPTTTTVANDQRDRRKMAAVTNNDDDVGCGFGGDEAFARYYPDSYQYTSSSEDEEDGDDVRRTRYVPVKVDTKRRSMGNASSPSEDIELLSPAATVVARRRQSSPMRRMPIDSEATIDPCIEVGSPDRKGRSLDRNTDAKQRMMQATVAKHGDRSSEKETTKMAAKKTWDRMKNMIQARKDSLKRKHRKSSGSGGGGGSEATAGEQPSPTTDCDHANASEFYCDVIGGGGGQQSRTSKHSSTSSIYATENGNTTVAKRPQVDAHDRRLPTNDATQSSTSKSKWTNIKKVFPTTTTTTKKKDDGDHQDDGSEPSSPTGATKSFYFDDEDDAECRPSPSTVARRNLELQLRRNISHDFCKKLEEWERLRTRTGGSGCIGPAATSCPDRHRSQQLQLPLSRKGSAKVKGDKVKPQPLQQQHHHESHDDHTRDKQLQWLQKQLQKIEREKRRLAKQREKYAQREARLDRLRESTVMMMMTSSHPQQPTDATARGGAASKRQEVLIRTSEGEFRFEGISQTFTRRLYEWEAMKGIGPEVSTIALLDAVRRPTAQPEATFASAVRRQPQHRLEPPIGGRRCGRSRSHSDGIAADVQTSTTSLLQLLQDDDATTTTDDATVAPRVRSNSKPEMTFRQSIHNDDEDQRSRQSPSCAMWTVERCATETKPQALGVDDDEDVGRLQLDDQPPKFVSQKQSEECHDNENREKSLGQLTGTGNNEPEKANNRRDTENEQDEMQPTRNSTTEPEMHELTDHQPKMIEKKTKKKKNKDGVVKIQSLSSELLRQAKVLEEALQQKNETIGKLQRELMQRDIVPAPENLKLQHKCHSRSWSSPSPAAAAVALQRQHRLTTDNGNDSEVAVLPMIELTGKVRELKTELMRLWSSTDSSSAMEQGSEDKSSDQNTNRLAPDELDACTSTAEAKQNSVPSEEDEGSVSDLQRASGAPAGCGSERPTTTMETDGRHQEQQHNASRMPRTPDVDGSSRERPVRVAESASSPSSAIAITNVPTSPGRGSPSTTSVVASSDGSRDGRMSRWFVRQNAKDVAGSSDTDTEESSGVTVAVENVQQRKAVPPEKPERRSRVPKPPSATVVRREPSTATTEAGLDGASLESPAATRTRPSKGRSPNDATVIDDGETPPPPPKARLATGVKEPSPNVRMMVERFNRKIDESESQQTSPSPGRLRRRWISSPGVQKATTGTAPQTTPPPPSANDRVAVVVKSASAGTVDGRTSLLRFPQSPTFPATKSRTTTSLSDQLQLQQQQPVGIASRIPRSLKSIVERDGSIEGNDDDDGHGTPSSPDVTKERRPFVRHLAPTSPSTTTTKLPVANKQPCHGRATARSSTTTAEAVMSPKMPRSPVTNNDRRSRSEIREESSANRAVAKSASAGAVESCGHPKDVVIVETAKPRGHTTTSNEDVTSSSKVAVPHQLQKSGLFNFKFGKARSNKQQHQQQQQQQKLPQPLTTVKALCRQSLVVDIVHDKDKDDVIVTEIQQQHTDKQQKSPSSGSGQIGSKSCPSSPETQSKQRKSGSGGSSWLAKPKILFKSK